MKDLLLELIVETKVCKICKLEKPLDRFYQQGRKSLDNRCKACANEGKTWRRRERKKYEHLDTGFCHCCGRKSDSLHFDHDHNTKKYRGFLCHFCNTGIGKLGDNIEGVNRALRYLERHEEKNG
tara:strand:+ start:3996 stop:4367 length:372 start_codon:yes stop_codon:yes gene_type:complete